MTRDIRSDVWLQPLVISALQSNGRTDGAICYAPLSQLETERAVLADVKREAAEIITGLERRADSVEQITATMAHGIEAVAKYIDVLAEASGSDAAKCAADSLRKLLQ